jgi:hypothetical protein
MTLISGTSASSSVPPATVTIWDQAHARVSAWPARILMHLIMARAGTRDQGASRTIPLVPASPPTTAGFPCLARLTTSGHPRERPAVPGPAPARRDRTAVRIAVDRHADRPAGHACRRISRLPGASTLAAEVTSGNRRPARMPRCWQRQIPTTVPADETARPTTQRGNAGSGSTGRHHGTSARCRRLTPQLTGRPSAGAGPLACSAFSAHTMYSKPSLGTTDILPPASSPRCRQDSCTVQ